MCLVASWHGTVAESSIDYGAVHFLSLPVFVQLRQLQTMSNLLLGDVVINIINEF